MKRMKRITEPWGNVGYLKCTKHIQTFLETHGKKKREETPMWRTKGWTSQMLQTINNLSEF